MSQSIASGTFKVTTGPKLKNHGPPPDPAGLVLPHWNSSFRTEGIDYPFTVIGGDPAARQTTVIPVVIVPYRFKFADGSAIDASTDVIDGDTPLNRTLASPVFNDYPFVSGGTPLGPTQWGDAYMRGSFWSLHGGQNSGYHVRLQVVRVASVQEIEIPADEGFTLTFGSEKIGFVDYTYMDGLVQERTAALGVPPSMLTIHLAGEVVSFAPIGPAAAGFHTARDLSSITGVPGVNTYIETGTFPDQSALASGHGNGAVLAHEIVEWLMDPLVGNLVPVWQEPSIPGLCDNWAMEVADPLEWLPGTAVTFNDRSYRFPDVAFLPWFGRIASNYSVNGWYSMGNSLTSYSQKCRFFDTYVYYYFPNVPGEDAAYLTSLNTAHQATLYAFFGGAVGSYLLSNVDPLNPDAPPVTVSPIQVPGALVTYALHVNDQGQVVGVWFDAQAREHGFLLTNGQYTTIDAPGATATEVLGINGKNRPTLVGDYVDGSGAVHGFTLQGGNFKTVDVPGAVGTTVTGVNDMNQIVGTFQSLGGAAHGFSGNLGTIDTTLDYPLLRGELFDTMLASINNAGHVAGTATSATYISPASVQNAFVFGAGNFIPVDENWGYDGLPTTLNDINNNGLLAGSFVVPGSGPTAAFAVPYSLFYPIVYSGLGSPAGPPSGAVSIPSPFRAPIQPPAGN